RRAPARVRTHSRGSRATARPRGATPSPRCSGRRGKQWRRPDRRGDAAHHSAVLTAARVGIPLLPTADWSQTQVAADEIFHDLGGATEDRLDPDVDVVAGHFVLVHVAVP